VSPVDEIGHFKKFTLQVTTRVTYIHARNI